MPDMYEPFRELLYRQDVSDEMLKVYGITWSDACGDLEPLLQARKDGKSPEDFVAWFGNKYDLTPKKDW